MQTPGSGAPPALVATAVLESGGTTHMRVCLWPLWGMPQAGTSSWTRVGGPPHGSLWQPPSQVFGGRGLKAPGGTLLEASKLRQVAGWLPHFESWPPWRLEMQSPRPSLSSCPPSQGK